jgi:hypothetical protein
MPNADRQADMTRESGAGGSDSADLAAAHLREELLLDAVEGCLPLAHFDSVVGHVEKESVPARQALLLRIVRSLIENDLMVVGRIGGEEVECVEPWELSLEDAMYRFYDEYVVNHDDSDWVFGIWFALTERGEQAAQGLEARQFDS